MSDNAFLVLEAIRALTKEQRVPPTYREVADRLGWRAHSHVYALVQQLRKEGYIEEPKSRFSRSLLVTPRGARCRRS